MRPKIIIAPLGEFISFSSSRDKIISKRDGHDILGGTCQKIKKSEVKLSQFATNTSTVYEKCHGQNKIGISQATYHTQVTTNE